MKFSLKIRRRQKDAAPLQHATASALETLENRIMLSTHRHRTTLAPAEVIGGAQLLVGAFDTTRVQELRTMYGVAGLDAQNPAFPITNTDGAGSRIVIIGSMVPGINNESQIEKPATNPGNLAQFAAKEPFEAGFNGAVNLTVGREPVDITNFIDQYDSQFPIDPTDPTKGSVFGFDSPDNPYYDFTGSTVTTGMIEWAFAMSPGASITVIECPTSNGVIAPSVLSLAIQQGVRDLNETSPGAIDTLQPGGVMLMGITSKGEDAALSAQYDALFSYKYAASTSFIAPAGDYGGTTSMPANSPWVTSVGGTAWQSTGAFARSFEVASLNSGGNNSTVEPVPAFQKGLTANGKRLTGRGTVDLTFASATPANSGIEIYDDPTPLANSPQKQFEANGTEISAAAIAGMVADVNSMRHYAGLGTIGRDLNNELYNAYKTTPGAFFDVTQGNNTLNQASRGYDLASGLGSPQANLLIPALAGISTQGAKVTAQGDIFLANTGLVTTSLVLPLRGTGTVDIGSQFISFLNLSLTGTQSITNNGTTTTTTFVATFTPTGLITRNLNNTITGTGTVTLTGGSTPETFNVSITGKVSIGKRGRASISGQIFTVDLNGKRVPFGVQDIFQATFSA